MEEIITRNEVDSRVITIYRRTEREVPIVIMNSYMEASPDILRSCQKHDSPAFQLVSISQLAWDEDLSPWPSEPVVSQEDHFTGEADAYCDWIRKKVLPIVRGELPESPYLIIAGYSMGGLFAVYAPYVTDMFARCVCASGSVWYPNFLEYAKRTPFIRKPDAVYFSIGNQESKSSNSYLRTTQDHMEQLAALYDSEGIHTIFELNPGNHYQNAPQRMAKGIAWTLRQPG